MFLREELRSGIDFLMSFVKDNMRPDTMLKFAMMLEKNKEKNIISYHL
jgi:hypothetical protein